MKKANKILALLLLLLLCTALFACKQGGTDGKKPAGLTEKVRYDYTAEGFAVIKSYENAKGQVLTEQIYMIDSGLGVLSLYSNTENTFDKSGKLTGAVACQTQNAIYAVPDKTLTLGASADARFGYEVKDGSGNLVMYLREESDSLGRTVKAEYFTAGGRLYMTETVEYHENGAPKAFTASDSTGEVLCTVSYNTRGNFTSATVTEGKTTTRVSAEYYGSGTIKSYTSTSTDEAGGYTSAPETVTFNENGDVKEYGDFKPSYYSNGKPKTSSDGDITYTFNENGTVTKKDDFSSTVHPETTTYEYDKEGRLVNKTAKSNGKVSSKTLYTYEQDGTYKEEKFESSGKLTQRCLYDANGNVTKSELYSGDKLYASQVYAYDALGRLVKHTVYSGTSMANPSGTATYAYNVHGDVTELKSNGTLGQKHVKYEYSASGKLKKLSSLDVSGKVLQSIDYFDDGSYRLLSGNYMVTYDKYDRLIAQETAKGTPVQKKYYEYYTGKKLRSYFFYSNNTLVESEEYREDGKPIKIVKTGEYGKKTETIYEYYEDGKQKLLEVYTGGVLTSCAKYNTDGNLTEMTARDENGKLFTAVYTRENGVPARIDTYRENVLAEYTLLEYFTYTSDEKNDPKSIRTYDKNGALILNMVYDKINVQINPGYVYALVRQEVFENGVIIASAEMEYSPVNGNLAKKTEKAGTVCVKTEFNTANLSGKEEVLTRSTFSEGKLVSYYERTIVNNKAVYREAFYGEDGLATHIYVYGAQDAENPISEIYTYEYHKNGKPSREERHTVKNGKTLLTGVKCYSISGALTLQEDYKYSSSGSFYSMESISYGEDGKVVRTASYKALSDKMYIDSELLYEYHANGKTAKETELHYLTDGTVSRSTVKEYDEEGRLLHSLYKSGASTMEETICEYGANGTRTRYEVLKNGEVKQLELTELDENGNAVRIYKLENGSEYETLMSYNSAGLMLEKTYFVNGAEKTREVCEYHENGEKRSVTVYAEKVILSKVTNNSYGLKEEVLTYREGTLYEREVFSYHKNKQVSAHLKYRGETLVSETYYNESGFEIQK